MVVHHPRPVIVMDEIHPGHLPLDGLAREARELLELRVRHGDGRVGFNQDGGGTGVLEDGSIPLLGVLQTLFGLFEPGLGGLQLANPLFQRLKLFHRL
jgi:hypothetical protein